MRERSISSVPTSALALLALALALQIGWNGWAPLASRAPMRLVAPPSLATLRLSALGEPIALSRLLMLHVQTVDSGAGNNFHRLDYAILTDWLTRVSDLDPASQYPLISASHVYAEGGDDARQRRMLDFVYQRFLLDPNRRWRALVQATTLAKHRLHDLPLALRYARALRERATGPAVPNWVKQLEVFVLEDMNELDSAKILIGGFLASGQVSDPHERRFLQQRLDQLAARQGAKK